MPIAQHGRENSILNNRRPNVLRFPLPLLLVACSFLTLPFAARSADVEKDRQEFQKVEQEVLSKLYQMQPSAKAAVTSAAGYATFKNFGTKILFVGGGTGKGVAVNNKTKQRFYMRMGELQAGVGLGIKKFLLVFVFETGSALNSFVNQGWEFGGQATAAATTGKEGSGIAGALSVAPGVWLYQITDQGLALEATVKGTKYWKDGKLN
jgi:lipid-binding SYLF domain-containing protein